MAMARAARRPFRVQNRARCAPLRDVRPQYLLLTEDQAVLYEFTGCMHLAHGFETLTDVRPAITASFVAAGERIAEREGAWAADMAATIREAVGTDVVVGVERLNAGAALAFAAEGFRLIDAQAAVERARAIKSAVELKCVMASLRATEVAVGRLREAIRPGVTENALWSVLQQALIEQDGDYCETGLLSSGRRTNPWFQETGLKVIAAPGDKSQTDAAALASRPRGDILHSAGTRPIAARWSCRSGCKTLDPDQG